MWVMRLFFRLLDKASESRGTCDWKRREYFRKERDYFREITFRNPGQARLLPQRISPLLHASLGETQSLDIESLPSHLFDAPSGDKGLEDGACKEVLGSLRAYCGRK